MIHPLPRKTILKLSIVFALVYFFSTNGLASLPGVTISFLLKDTLKMSAAGAAYFGAVTIIGWAVKPLWGIISDILPIRGYRRKPYLVATALAAALVWLSLGQIENYTVSILLILFTLSSAAYAFMDVICDALMVETGKPHGLTGRFQAVQWTAVYLASIIAGILGGWVAKNLSPQIVFTINAVFPAIILAVVLFFIAENKVSGVKEQAHRSLAALKNAFSTRTLPLLAFFLFFWTFSPSFGTPFFYYAVDTLKFDQMLFGIGAAVSAASSALGALVYGKFGRKFKTRTFIKAMIIVGVIATLFDLIYFTSFITENLRYARIIYLASAALLGAVGAITFLVLLNAAALAAPKYSEGTAFAALTSFWNIGIIGSSALGGFLFSKIGLQPLIVVSAVFTALTWVILPFLQFADENAPVGGAS